MSKFLKYIIILSILCLTLIIGVTSAKYILTSSFKLNVTLSIDKTAPKVNIVDINKDSIDNKNNSAIEYATVTYSDELSGIASAIWKYNSTAKDFSTSEAHNFASGTKFTNEGWYEITITDRAENTSKIVFRIDWAVARIKQKYYKRLEYAINDVPVTSSTNTEEDITIYMLRNVTETNTINENKTVILDINKTTITGDFTVKGKMTVKNGTVNTKTDSTATFNNNGTLEILSGTYTSKSNIIKNKGTVNVTGGNITSSTSAQAISSTGGTVNVKGGTVANTGTGHIVNIAGGTANLTGGTYTGNITSAYINNNAGILNVKGANITSSASNAITTNSTTKIESGTIKTTGKGNTVSIVGGTTVISGGTIQNTANGKTINVSSGTLNITNGNIYNTGTSNIIKTTGGTTNLSGGNYVGNGTSHWLEVDNGTLNYKGANITNSKIVDILRVHSGTVNMSSGTLTSTGDSAGTGAIRCLTVQGGTFNMTGGIITGKSNDGNNCSFDGGTANLNGGTIQNSQTISNFPGSFAAISIYNNSNVTLDGTTVKNTTHGIGIFIYNGNLNIKSGNISTNDGSALFIADDSNQTTAISGGMLDSKAGSGTLWIGGSARGICRMTRWYYKKFRSRMCSKKRNK